MMPSARSLILLKAILFLLCLVPAAWLTWGVLQDRLGANPFEVLTRETGLWTLRFLLLTLLVRPLAEQFKRPWILRFRRMLGLYSFFYAILHMLTYLWFDQFFDWQEIGVDIAKRPYITIGMLAFTLLIPLAVTSTRAMMRRLGKRWQRLHRLIYLIAPLGVVHFLLLIKADIREPLLYGFLLALLLGYRLRGRLRRRTLAATASR